MTKKNKSFDKILTTNDCNMDFKKKGIKQIKFSNLDELIKVLKDEWGVEYNHQPVLKCFRTISKGKRIRDRLDLVYAVKNIEQIDVHEKPTLRNDVIKISSAITQWYLNEVRKTTFIVGLPGSSKSVITKELFRSIVVDMDDVWFDYGKGKFKDLGQDFMLDNDFKSKYEECWLKYNNYLQGKVILIQHEAMAKGEILAKLSYNNDLFEWAISLRSIERQENNRRLRKFYCNQKGVKFIGSTISMYKNYALAILNVSKSKIFIAIIPSEEGKTTLSKQEKNQFVDGDSIAVKAKHRDKEGFKQYILDNKQLFYGKIILVWDKEYVPEDEEIEFSGAYLLQDELVIDKTEINKRNRIIIKQQIDDVMFFNSYEKRNNYLKSNIVH